MEQRQTFQLPAEDTEAVEKGELFADYLERWLKIAKSTIAITTYSSYDGMMKSTIVPWFRKTGVTITELTAQDIQDFYTAQLARVKSNTVIHYHALIHRALKYAVKTDQLSVNPADKVDRPRKNGFQPAFYDKDEINQLLACVKGTLIETPVMLAAFLRFAAQRSRWAALGCHRLPSEHHHDSAHGDCVQAEREVRGHRPRYHENEVKPPDAAACSANPEVSA